MDKNKKVRKDKVTRPLTQKQVLEKIERGESFEGVEIGDVDFTNYFFEKPINFNGAIFNGEANFFRAHFKNENGFREAQFYGNANFSETKFKGMAHFQSVQFQGEANFILAQFQEEARFGGAKFQGNAYFHSVHFQNWANFTFALFHKMVSFTLAQFQNLTNFTCAHFHRKADFLGACFQELTNFHVAEFFDGATFNAVRFHGEVHFRDTNFQGVTDFSNTTFFERTFFSGSEETRLFSNTGLINMRQVQFEKPTQVVFQLIDFSRCCFVNTNLDRVELTDVIWPIKNGIFGKRTVIYDEINPEPEIGNYLFIEKIYRDLKKNYENRGSYGEAGDFHYGEMEMRRLSQKPIFRYVSLLWLYKILSGYGEKHWRALFWLGVFLLVYMGVYRFIEYSYLPLRDGLWNSFVHALEVITFQRSHIYPSVSPQGKLADIFLTITFSLQATLAILAIKRKFKR